MDIVGDGKFRYKVIETWPNIPKYWKLGIVSDGAVNSPYEIYLFSRGSHPIKLRTIYHLGLSNSSCTKKYQLNRVSHHLNQKRQEMVLPID